MQFIDIHNHVIPHWDDGAADWDMSLAMLQQAQEDGIVELICTPHVLAENDMARESELLDLFEELKKKAKAAGISIKLHIGSELYIQPILELDRTISTLAQNKRYFLVEFSMSIIPDFVAQRFFELVMENRIPIVAHPERYGAIMENPHKAFDFVERGALMQLNAGSLLGMFGSRVQSLSHKLMDSNLIHFIGSDGHDLERRPVKLRKAFEYVKEKWGEDRAKMLFYENQKKMMNAEDIDIGAPQMIVSEKQTIKNRFSGLFKRNRE
jgi:protein-tyrosine phosphatase